STDRLKVMEWAIVNAVTIPRTPKKSLAEARYGQPSSVTVLEHRREQQGAEKQDVIEGFGEALTGVRIGWVLSRENNTHGTPTLCTEWKATRTGAPARAPGRPGAVVDPSMCVSSLRGNRRSRRRPGFNKNWPASGR